MANGPRPKPNVPGRGIDAFGGGVVDPTENVKDLVQADKESNALLRASEKERIDDLRRADKELARAQVQHTRQILALTTRYEDKLRVAEKGRIDAIRAVDVGAVAVAAERSSQQAAMLASQVTQSAEILRALVQSTASALENRLQSLSNGLTERLAAIEKTQYESKGRAELADPAVVALTEQVKTLAALASEKTGKETGWKAGTGWIVAIVSLVFLVMGGIAGAVMFWINFTSRAGGNP
jgi:hypothetical protein